MLRLGAIVLQVSDLERATAFWSAALDYAGSAEHPAFLAPGADHVDRLPARGVRLHLDGDDRTHLDLWADGPDDQRAQVERLIGLGARRVEWDYPDDADFVVLADPEGTLFCVIA